MNANFQWLGAQQGGAVGQFNYAPTALPAYRLPTTLAATTTPVAVFRNGTAIARGNATCSQIQSAFRILGRWINCVIRTPPVVTNIDVTGLNDLVIIQVLQTLGFWNVPPLPVPTGSGAAVAPLCPLGSTWNSTLKRCVQCPNGMEWPDGTGGHPNCPQGTYVGATTGTASCGCHCVSGTTWDRTTRSCTKTITTTFVPSTVYGAPFQWLAAQPGMLGQASCSACGNDVCWWCWGKDFFESCKRSCEGESTDPKVLKDCICFNCVNDGNCGTPPAGAQNAYPWRQYASETCALQSQTNDILRDNGYQLLNVDCILGGRTCGAASYANGIDSRYTLPNTCLQHRSEWIAPTLIGAPPPAPAPAPDCRTNPSLCTSTQSCDATTGDCFEDCRKPGAAACGAGQMCDQTSGNCVAAPAAAKKAGGAGAGVFVLGLAALAGIGYALFGRG